VGQGLSPAASIPSGATLALDAATSTVVAGLVGPDGQILSERRLSGGRGDVVPGMVSSMLEELGVGSERISAVVCGVGPGSFTGIRIALSFAHGFAFRRGLPLAGVSSLAAALVHPSLPVDRPRVALLDALRGEAYCRRLEAGAELSDDSDARVPLDQIHELLGGSPVVLAEGRKDFLEAIPGGWLALSEFVHPLGLVVLRACGGAPLPNYLRASAPEEIRAQRTEQR
jgi:tRNA threonylcarbamoyl adenosine modification protein YeaZ